MKVNFFSLLCILILMIVFAERALGDEPSVLVPTLEEKTETLAPEDTDKSVVTSSEDKGTSEIPQRQGTFGTLVAPEKGPNSCSGNGECRVVFANIQDQTKPPEMLYLCFGNYRYMGDSCDDCRKGYYGTKCTEGDRNPADNSICGKYGLGDDGIKGTGECFCKGSDLEPSLFCESASHESILEEEENFTLIFFIILGVIFLSLLVLYMYSKAPILENFPECMIAVILGLLIGFSLKYIYHNSSYHKIAKFESHTYFLFMLPPIMFMVGFSMNAATFFRNIYIINIFAIGSTIVGSLVFGLIMFYTLKLTSIVSYGFLECLQIGGIMSAIDPVATMSIFK